MMARGEFGNFAEDENEATQCVGGGLGKLNNINIDSVISDINRKIGTHNSRKNEATSHCDGRPIGGVLSHIESDGSSSCRVLGHIESATSIGTAGSSFPDNGKTSKAQGTICLSLREWMAQTQTSLSENDPDSSESLGMAPPAFTSRLTQNFPDRPIVSSKAYLTAALKIGRSLASQLDELEKLEATAFWSLATKNSNNSVLPSNYLNWSEHVVVEMLASQVLDGKNVTGLSGCQESNVPPFEIDRSSSEQNGQINYEMQQHGSHQYASSKDNEINGITFTDDLELDDFRHLSGDFSYSDFSVDGLFDEEKKEKTAAHDEVGARSSNEPAISSCEKGHEILDVVQARIKEVPVDHANSQRQTTSQTDQRGRNETNERIHALGIVFCELFSGGMRPKDLSTKIANGTDESDDPRYDPLTLEESKTIDFTSALKLLDEFDFSEDNNAGLDQHIQSRHTTLGSNEEHTRSLQMTYFSSDGSDFSIKPHNDPWHSQESEYRIEGINITEDDKRMRKRGSFLCQDRASSTSKLPYDPDIVDGLDFDDDAISSQSFRNKRAFRDPCLKKSALCIDVLKSLLIPPVICEMVSNMIDSANGELSGENAYTSIRDVLDDLDWMMAKLNQILSNNDPNEIITRGLQIGDSLYEREAEMSQLMQTYERSLSGVSIAMISGPSGIGKSRLAKELGVLLSQKGVQKAEGKFDQLQQANPFSAIASALNEYCGSLVEDGSDAIATIASEIKTQMRRDGIIVLQKLIPNLKDFFQPDLSGGTGHSKCVDASKRIQYFLCSFVEIIASLSPAGFTLFLDDLQWADSSSIQIIHQLLMRLQFSKQKYNFFLLGCFRDGAPADSSPFQNWIKNFDRVGATVTMISLKTLDKECVNTFVSDALCLPPRLTRPLSVIVHHKSQGNHLYMIQLLRALQKDESLYFSKSQRRWRWDLEKANEKGISDNVAMVLTSTISSLPLCVRDAICIASCFGAALEISIATKLEILFESTLLGSLDIAVKEGLMDKRGNKWHFAHDKVQEAAYKMMKEEERCLYHSNYGIALSSVALEDGNSDLLLTAVDQINRGGPSAISDRSQNSIVAELNLKAGNISADRSDFATAFSFYDNGISFLRKGHWREHYKLSLGLFTEAVHCALVIGDFSSLAILSDQVIRNATSLHDKLPVIYDHLRALEAGARFAKAVEKGVSILNQLGVRLLGQSSSWKENGLLTETKSMLSGYSDDDLLGLGKMEDHIQVMTVKFLERMVSLLGLSNPAAQPEATLKLVQLTLRGGLSSVSPIGFAFYGSLLGVLGEVRDGYRYVRIALKLVGSRESTFTREAASVVYGIGGHFLAYIEPLQSLADFMFHGHKYAMECGDTSSATLCLMVGSASSYWCGNHLRVTISSMENSLNRMKEYNSITWMTHLLPLYRTTLSMIGQDEGIPTLLGNISVDKETEKETALLQQNVYVFKFVHFNKMYIEFIFRRFCQMKSIAEKCIDFSPPVYVILLSQASHVFYHGLVSFWIARENVVPCQNIWFERGEKALSIMKSWSDECIFNFQHKLFLLEAEKSFCTKDINRAEKFYDASILSAKTHKFIHEEALSCELAGYFFIDMDQHDKADLFLKRSQERYQSWGAYAKVNQLKQFIHNRKILNGR